MLRFGQWHTFLLLFVWARCSKVLPIFSDLTLQAAIDICRTEESTRSYHDYKDGNDEGRRLC
jgi:hypothetical protein